jgi:hypothetical protein
LERTGNKSREEGLGGKVLVVLLEVLLARADELDGSELEAAVLEALDDGANESALYGVLVPSLLLRNSIDVMYGRSDC